MVVLTI